MIYENVENSASEAKIFEDKKQRDIKYNRKNQKKFPRLSGFLRNEKSRVEVEQNRSEHQNDEFRLAPGIKNQA